MTSPAEWSERLAEFAVPSSGFLRDGRKTAIRVHRLWVIENTWHRWAAYAADPAERAYAEAKAARALTSRRRVERVDSEAYQAFLNTLPGRRFDCPSDDTRARVSAFAATKMPVAAALRRRLALR